MVTVIKERIKLLKVLVIEILESPIPNLTYQDLENDPRATKTEWERAELVLQDLEMYLQEYEGSRKDWMGYLSKQSEANRALADTEMNTFLEENAPNLRTLHKKIRDLKKESAQWRVNIQEYDRNQNRTASGLDNDSTQGQQNEMFEANKKAMEKMARAFENLSRRSAAPADDPDFAAQGSSKKGGINLPPIKLQTFKGGRDWAEFWDQYHVGIHKDNSLSSARKLIYLKTLVEGEPKDLIYGLSNIDKNYMIAVEILQKKYGNNEANIQQLHMDLANLKPSTTFAEDVKLQIEAEKIMRQLECYKEDVNNPQVLIALQNKVSKPTLRKIMELKKLTPADQKWDTKKFRKALNIVIQDESEVEQIYRQKHSIIRKENPAEKSHRKEPKLLSGDQTMAFAAVGKPFEKKVTSANENKGNFVGRKRDKYCVLCEGGNHSTAECRKHPNIRARLEQAKKMKLCARCFRNDHKSWQCVKVFRPCFWCKGSNHISPLCPSKFKTEKETISTVFDGYESEEEEKEEKADEEEYVDQYDSEEEEKPEEQPEEEEEEEKEEQVTTSFVALKPKQKMQRILQCAKVKIFNPKRPTKTKEAYIVFDNGSQRSFIREDLAKSLNLSKLESIHLNLSGFMECDLGNVHTNDTQFGVMTKFGPMLVEGTRMEKIIKPVTYIPIVESELNEDELLIPKDIVKTDILIGIDQIRMFEIVDRYQLPSGFWISDSKVGPFISGKGQTKTKGRQIEQIGITIMANVLDMDEQEELKINLSGEKLKQIENLWFSNEEMGLKDVEINDEDIWIKQLNIQRDEEGRYAISLPYNDRANALLPNYGLAYGRLLSNLKHMKQKPELILKIDEIFKEQLKLDIIEKVIDWKHWQGVLHYIPHQPVIREDKETTKVRNVSDASAKDKNGLSINQCLEKGPTQMNDISGIQLRSRLPKYLICADIEKAFLQIRIKEEDRDALRFLWKDNPLDDQSPIVVYRFKGMPFGLISSPACLNTILSLHLDQHGSELAKQIKNNIYVDDITQGEENEDRIIPVCNEMKDIFKTAMMNLRGFCVNHLEAYEKIPEEDRAKMEGRKILGIRWDPKEDTITIPLPEWKEGSKCTKRTMLSQTASVFDTLGLTSPSLLSAKRIIQSVWKLDLNWDNPVPEDIQKAWIKCMEDWKEVKFTFPRRLFSRTLSGSKQLSLEVFADASGYAFGIVVYLRAEFEDKSVQFAFLQGKSLVRPINLPEKQNTIPKMELHALKLAVKLAIHVQKELKSEIEVKKIQLWTDSKDAIDWLNSHKRHERFIQNRLNVIRPFEVKHVKGELNPSDIASRGCTAIELMNHPYWFHGPLWMNDENSEILSEFNSEKWHEEEMTMEKYDTILNINIKQIKEDECLVQDWSRYNSLSKLKRIVSYVQMFTDKCKEGKQKTNKLPKNEDELNKLIEKLEQVTAEQMAKAEILLIREAQQLFPPEANLFREKQFEYNEVGLLICQSRLTKSDLTMEAKIPIYLPKNSPLTKLFIKYYHWKLYHAGISTVLAELRQRFYIPQARRTVFDVLNRNLLTKCYVCIKHKTKAYALPKMPPLPTYRVLGKRPFQFIGLDYFGPMIVKESDKNQKVWGCLFTCATTRAIHIELVEDCTASEFLLAFKRFIGRRMEPEIIISDNALQFKLASRIIKRLWSKDQSDWNKVFTDKEVRNFTSENGIRWQFITDRAPWAGGMYEKMIDLTKKPLKRVLGKTLVKKSELQTILIEIERIVNSRPLTYMGESDTIRPLRPIDFLIPYQTASYREGVLELELPMNPTKENLENRFRILSELSDKIWNIWRTDYLLALRDSQKFGEKKGQKILELGEVILVDEENLPRSRWRMGVVTEFRMSSDGKVRSAVVRVWDGKKWGQINRPINKLYPLEVKSKIIEQEQNSLSEKIDRINENDQTPLSEDVNLIISEPMAENQDTSQMIEDQETSLSGNNVSSARVQLENWELLAECDHEECEPIWFGNLLEMVPDNWDKLNEVVQCRIRYVSIFKLITMMWVLTFGLDEHQMYELLGNISNTNGIHLCMECVKFKEGMRKGKGRILNTKPNASMMKNHKIKGKVDGLKFTRTILKDIFKLWMNKCKVAERQLHLKPWGFVTMEVVNDEWELAREWADTITMQRIPLNYALTPDLAHSNVVFIGDELSVLMGQAFGKCYMWQPSNIDDIVQEFSDKLFLTREVDHVILYFGKYTLERGQPNRIIGIWDQMRTVWLERGIVGVFIMPPTNKRELKAKIDDNFNLFVETRSTDSIRVLNPNYTSREAIPSDEDLAMIIQQLEYWNISNEEKPLTWQERKGNFEATGPCRMSGRSSEMEALHLSGVNEPGSSGTSRQSNRSGEETLLLSGVNEPHYSEAQHLSDEPCSSNNMDQLQCSEGFVQRLANFANQCSIREDLHPMLRPRKRIEPPSPDFHRKKARDDSPNPPPVDPITDDEEDYGGPVKPFFGCHSFLSNMFEASFELDGRRYISSEHAYQYAKAMYFGYTKTAADIIRYGSPFTAKRLAKGYRLNEQYKKRLEPGSRPYIRNEWRNHCIMVMRKIAAAKFEQNPQLAEMLLRTKPKILAEMTETDDFWGTGIAIGHRDEQHRERWPGQNLMGQILMEVRNNLQLNQGSSLSGINNPPDNAGSSLSGNSNPQINAGSSLSGSNDRKENEEKATQSNILVEINYNDDELDYDEEDWSDRNWQGNIEFSDLLQRLKIQFDNFNKLTDEMWEFYATNVQSRESYERKMRVVDDIQRKVGALGTVTLFGSSRSHIGKDNSDLDMCIIPPGRHVKVDEVENANKYQKEMLFVVRRLPFKGYSSQVHGGRVPVLRLVGHNMQIDITYGNSTGLRNTTWLKHLCSHEARLAPLLFSIKEWAKFHRINDASRHSFSSWTWILLTIFALQHTDPPVFPPLSEDMDKLEKSRNNSSIAELIMHFFGFWNKHPLEKDSVSVREGNWIPKKRQTYIVEVEEPLKPEVNTTACIESSQQLRSITKAIEETKVKLFEESEEPSLERIGINYKAKGTQSYRGFNVTYLLGILALFLLFFNVTTATEIQGNQQLHSKSIYSDPIGDIRFVSWMNKIYWRKLTMILLPWILQLALSHHGRFDVLWRLMAIVLFSRISMAQQLMICDPEVNRFYYRLPDVINEACKSTPSRHQASILSIFKPNNEWVELDANLCRKVDQKLKYWENLITENRSNITQKFLTISKEECQQMEKQGRCEFGNLSGSPTAQTFNLFEPPVEYSYFRTKYARTENCFSTPTKILFNPFSGELNHPLVEMKGCELEDEFCAMKDNQVLIWKKKQQFKTCQWIKWEKANGTLDEDVWTRSDGQFALSFRTINNEDKLIEDCGTSLVLTDQHYAIHKRSYDRMRAIQEVRNRPKRDLSGSGTVRSEQLAAVTTMSAYLTNQRDRAMFFNLLCQNRNDFRQQDATSTLRFLLNSTNLQARWVGKEIAEVWPCTPVDDFNFTKIDEKGECFHKLPVNASFGGKIVQGFVESESMILVETSKKGPCSIFGKQAIMKEGKLILVDQTTGTKEEVDEKSIQQLKLQHNLGIPEFKPDIFTNLVVTNESNFGIFLRYFKTFRVGRIMQKHITPEENEWNTQHGDYIPIGDFSITGFLKNVDWEKFLMRAWITFSIGRFLKMHGLPWLIRRGINQPGVLNNLFNLIQPILERQMREGIGPINMQWGMNRQLGMNGNGVRNGM